VLYSAALVSRLWLLFLLLFSRRWSIKQKTKDENETAKLKTKAAEQSTAALQIVPSPALKG
jgi:hypothetical protein